MPSISIGLSPGSAAALGGALVWQFEVDTTAISAGSSNNDQFKLPLVSTGTYDFTVDWGDSSSDNITVWNDAATTHTYAAGGTYTVKITGTIEGIRFNNSGDRLKIGDVSSWGPLVLTNVGGGHFYGCTNLTCAEGALVTPPEIGVITDFSNMFRDASSFTSDLSAWNVSSGTSFLAMFYGASSFTSDLSSWNVSSGTSFSSMFRDASSFTSDLSSWNVSSGTSFSSMFFGASSFTSDLSSWNVSSGTSFGAMFLSASSFTSDLSAWNVSSGTDFSYMFYGVSLFTSDLSAWNVSSGTNFSNMFRNSSSFTSDLSSWDASSGTDFTNFANGAAFTTAHYDATLIGWEALDLVDSLSIHFGTTKYTSGGAAEAARAAIIADDLWTITDGGPV